MKSIIIKNGIIGGIIVSIVMAFMTIHMKQNPDYEPNMFIGFISMFLAFCFVVVGIIQQRKLNNGQITFLNAFKTGILITTIISIIYVIVWLIIYYNFLPNFMEQYAEMAIKNTKPEDVVKVKEELQFYQDIYQTPFGVIAMTLLEIFPFGLIFSLISALILKRKSTN